MHSVNRHLWKSAFQRPLRIMWTGWNMQIKSVQTVDLYLLPIATAVQQLGQCSGLVLTGGRMFFQAVRQGIWYAEMYRNQSHRDSLEMALIAKALELKMPLIGICRVTKILNVYLGGSLVIDIPSDRGTSVIHQCDDYLHCFHSVKVGKTTLLGHISMCDSAQVTTNHHQAVDRLSPQLISNARSDDNLIEVSNGAIRTENHFCLAFSGIPNGWIHRTPCRDALPRSSFPVNILFIQAPKR